ncbi:MAG: hypothetical protein AAFV95_01920 [Bacteroidota bacterium]
MVVFKYPPYFTSMTYIKKHGLFLLLLFPFFANGQNHLYNSLQFGVRNAMLGGAVTAGTDDPTMTYYNPAAIHLASSQLDISLLQPQVSNFGFDRFWQKGETSEINRDVGLEPSLISFKVRINKVDLAFLKIGKSEWMDFFNAKREATNVNLLKTQFFEYEYSGRDSWFGVGTSVKLNSYLSVGISQFFSLARFRYRNNILVETINVNAPPNRPVRHFNSDINSNYSNFSLLTNIGLLVDTKVHDIGIRITTPAFLRLRQGGAYNRITSNISLNQNTAEQLIDPDVSPTIKTPWEFHLGYSLVISPGRKIWLNGSYHSAIEEYEMAKIESAAGDVSWKNGSNAVVNFGISYSDQLTPNMELSCGIRSNYFAYENRAPSAGSTRNVIFDGDHFHLVLGTKFKFKNNTVLFGLDWGRLVESSDTEGFRLLTDVGRLEPDLEGLTKGRLGVLLTYGFVIDSFRNK